MNIKSFLIKAKSILKHEPRESLAVCRAKEAPSFLIFFKALSIDPVPGIEPATFRSAVKRSADGASPAAVKKQSETDFS